MQIGYLLYIDLIIFIAMAYSVIHYFSSSNRNTSINLSSYFKFSLYVLFTITLLDTFFSGHFSHIHFFLLHWIHQKKQPC